MIGFQQRFLGTLTLRLANRMTLSLLLLLPVALVCLRAAVALANRFLGPTAETAEPPAVEFESSYAQTPDLDNPYSAPGHMSVAVERTSKAIPEPSVGRSLIAVFVQWLGSMFSMFVMVLLAQFVSRGVIAGGVIVFVYPVAIAAVNAVIRSSELIWQLAVIYTPKRA